MPGVEDRLAQRDALDAEAVTVEAAAVGEEERGRKCGAHGPRTPGAP